MHLYWAMKNCGGLAEKLKALIDKIPAHYQVSAQNDVSFHHSLLSYTSRDTMPSVLLPLLVTL